MAEIRQNLRPDCRLRVKEAARRSKTDFSGRRRVLFISKRSPITFLENAGSTTPPYINQTALKMSRRNIPNLSLSLSPVFKPRQAFEKSLKDSRFTRDENQVIRMSSTRLFALLPVIGFMSLTLLQLSYGQSVAPSPSPRGPSNDGMYAIAIYLFSIFRRPIKAARFYSGQTLTDPSLAPELGAVISKVCMARVILYDSIDHEC